MDKEVIMNRKVFLAIMLFMALGMIGLLGQPASTQGPEGAVLTGVWSWHVVLPPAMFGPNAGMPSVVTFHNDGTVFWSDGLAFGGLPLAYGPYTYTPFYGVWERTGPHEFRLTFLPCASTGQMDYSPASCAYGRSSLLQMILTISPGRITWITLACPTPLTCPNPLTAPNASWVPWPTGPISFHAARISVVPY